MLGRVRPGILEEVRFRFRFVRPGHTYNLLLVLSKMFLPNPFNGLYLFAGE